MPFNPRKAGFLIVLVSTENGIFFYKVNPFPVDTSHPKTALFYGVITELLRGYFVGFCVHDANAPIKPKSG